MALMGSPSGLKGEMTTSPGLGSAGGAGAAAVDAAEDGMAMAVDDGFTPRDRVRLGVTVCACSSAAKKLPAAFLVLLPVVTRLCAKPAGRARCSLRPII